MHTCNSNAPQLLLRPEAWYLIPPDHRVQTPSRRTVSSRPASRPVHAHAATLARAHVPIRARPRPHSRAPTSPFAPVHVPIRARPRPHSRAPTSLFPPHPHLRLRRVRRRRHALLTARSALSSMMTRALQQLLADSPTSRLADEYRAPDACRAHRTPAACRLPGFWTRSPWPSGLRPHASSASDRVAGVSEHTARAPAPRPRPRHPAPAPRSGSAVPPARRRRPRTTRTLYRASLVAIGVRTRDRTVRRATTVPADAGARRGPRLRRDNARTWVYCARDAVAVYELTTRRAARRAASFNGRRGRGRGRRRRRRRSWRRHSDTAQAVNRRSDLD